MASQKRKLELESSDAGKSDDGKDGKDSPPPPEPEFTPCTPPESRVAPWRYYTVIQSAHPYSNLVGVHFGPHRGTYDGPWNHIRMSLGSVCCRDGRCRRHYDIREAILYYEANRLSQSPAVPQFFFYP